MVVIDLIGNNIVGCYGLVEANCDSELVLGHHKVPTLLAEVSLYEYQMTSSFMNTRSENLLAKVSLGGSE